MLSIHQVSRPRYKIRKPAELKPKFKIGDYVETRLYDDGELIILRGAVQSFSYISVGCKYQLPEGLILAPGFNYYVDRVGHLHETELCRVEACCG